MGKSWLPLKDERLLSFCSAFAATVTPAPEAYGLVASDAATLNILVTNYAGALAASANPAARTMTSVAGKQMAKVALSAGMRILYKRLNAANIANDQREALGLPVVGAGHMRIAAAAARPAVAIPQNAEKPMAIAA